MNASHQLFKISECITPIVQNFWHVQGHHFFVPLKMLPLSMCLCSAKFTNMSHLFSSPAPITQRNAFQHDCSKIWCVSIKMTKWNDKCSAANHEIKSKRNAAKSNCLLLLLHLLLPSQHNCHHVSIGNPASASAFEISWFFKCQDHQRTPTACLPFGHGVFLVS